MGTYIYTFRKRTNQINVDGEFQPVHAYAYAYKQVRRHWNDTRGEAVRDRQIEMAHDAFECAEDFPLVYVGDKPCDGANVYVATGGVWTDSYDFPGVLIGQMRKVGNRWHVVAQETTVDLARAYVAVQH